jgi:hypothetical protein
MGRRDDHAARSGLHSDEGSRVTDIEITSTGPREFAVHVHDGNHRTAHRDTVQDPLLGAQLVRESFEFLLDREPASSILREFSLDIAGEFFSDYLDELRRRLTPGM